MTSDSNSHHNKELTRRTFVGGVLVAGAGLAVSGLAACVDSDGAEKSLDSSGNNAPVDTGAGQDSSEVLDNTVSKVFAIENTNGADDGVQRLNKLMHDNGLEFFQTADSPTGIIGKNDVVILKINCQWAQRGGTNTDLLAEIADLIALHPEGFSGEVIIADNGQAQYGTYGSGGSLSWEETNSLSKTRSALDVVNELKERMSISGSLWDEFTMTRVEEFDAGDDKDGFVVDDVVQSTGIQISYPKFTSEYGTKISFTKGIWDAALQEYDSERLKIINVPVLKVHGLFQVTGAIKAYMGANASKLTGQSSHNSVGNGGMGTLMAHTRIPALNIMDMIWVGVERGPGITYDNAVEKNMIAASVDPVALDWWCTRNVLMPELEGSGDWFNRADPDSNDTRSFGYWLGLTIEEMKKAGITANRGISAVEAVLD